MQNVITKSFYDFKFIPNRNFKLEPIESSYKSTKFEEDDLILRLPLLSKKKLSSINYKPKQSGKIKSHSEKNNRYVSSNNSIKIICNAILELYANRIKYSLLKIRAFTINKQSLKLCIDKFLLIKTKIIKKEISDFTNKLKEYSNNRNIKATKIINCYKMYKMVSRVNLLKSKVDIIKKALRIYWKRKYYKINISSIVRVQANIRK
jgi:hypothetical protein